LSTAIAVVAQLVALARQIDAAAARSLDTG
jgi:hypothetical protein